MVARVPFNILDEWIFHLDQEPEPWSVHCEVRIPGRLDGERLAAAARAATAKHPIARARMASSGYWNRGYSWEIPDQVDHLPLEVLTCADDAELADARARLLSMNVSLTSSPPFALTLAHGPDGDSLIMNLHHAAGDGISAYRLMASIARAYAGSDDPIPDFDPLAVRDLRARARPQTLKSAISRARQLNHRFSEVRSHGTAVQVATQGGVDHSEGYRFSLLRLSATETEVVSASKRAPATINDLLIATLAIAIDRFNSDSGAPLGRISVMMPISLRPRDWSGEIVSNILSFVSASVLAPERTGLGEAQLAVETRTRALKEQRLAGTMIDMMRLSRSWPVGIKHLLARTTRGVIAPKVVDSALMSNLGRLSAPPDFGEDAGTATEIWFSPPAQMPLGAGIGVATMNGEMFLTLRYCPRKYDTADAAALMSAWREVMLGD